MASNMTKAFQTKSRRALGCRPGYAVGGTTDVFKTGSNSFSDMPGAGGQLMTPPMGGVGGGSPSLPATPPSYGTGPKQTGFVWEDGTPRVGATPAQPQAQAQLDPFAPAGAGRAPLMTRAEMARGASAQDIAPAGAGRAPLRTMAEQEMAQGMDPNRRYQAGRLGDPMASGLRAHHPFQHDPWGYADGGAVVKPQEDPAEAVMRRVQQNYGVAAPAPRPQAPAPAPTPAPAPQPEQRRTLGDIVRQRTDELNRIRNYAEGGIIPVDIGRGLVQAIAQPLAEDWRQGNQAIKALRNQYPTADAIAGIHPGVAAAQVANDVMAGDVGADTAGNVAQMIPIVRQANILTKGSVAIPGMGRVAVNMPATIKKNTAITAAQTLGQPANAYARGGIVRQRTDELNRIRNYADGGEVRQVEFQGPGGPRDDKIPVRFAGADIRVSDGERGVILPAKTAANPNAVDAIEDIIQSTNDGRAPRRGLGDGGRYADSNLIGPPKPGTHWLTNEPLAAPPNLHPDALQNSVSAAARGPAPGVNPWNDHITQSMGDAARLNGTQQSAEFARPQNIAPEIQIPADPAPVAEPQVRRGLVGRGVDALKGGARTAADATVKALGGTPGAPPAQPAPAAQPAAPVEKPPTPVTDRAKALGQSLGKGEVPGLIKTDAQGNRYLTKGGGAGAGAGAALQFGDHFDAFDTREGGLSHAQRAQLFARDLGVLAGGTAGAVGLGTVGFLGAGPVGAVAGGIPGGIGGAVYADKGMGKLREGINWANEKLGGAPNYFEDSDEMIARDRANREALGIKEGETQKVVRPVNAAIGSVLQSTGLINRDEASAPKTDTSNYSNEGRGRHQIDPSMVEPINRGGRAQVRSVDNAIDALTPVDIQRQRALGASTGNAGNVSVEKGGNGIRWNASPGYNPTREKFAPGTGVMTVTGDAVDGGRMMPGIKQHALGTSFAIGPGDYLAKDGSRTSDWTKTADYEGGLRRAEQNRVALAQIQNERAGRDPMASRALGQQMLPPGEDAATDMSSLEAGRASVARNLTSPNPGTRSLAAHQQHVLDTMVAQQQAQAKLGYDMKVKGAEMANADKAQTRADAEAYDKNLATIFRNPKGGKDGNEDVPDTEAIAEFKRMAAYTAKANLEEATTPEQRAKWISKMTGKARDAAELDAADHAQMLQQFKVRQRHLATMGNLWGDPDVGDSQRLDHWTPHITKDGEMVYFPKMTKGGKPISGKVKQYAYTRPITASRFQALETPTNDILADAIRDK